MGLFSLIVQIPIWCYTFNNNIALPIGILPGFTLLFVQMYITRPLYNEFWWFQALNAVHILVGDVINEFWCQGINIYRIMNIFPSVPVVPLRRTPLTNLLVTGRTAHSQKLTCILLLVWITSLFFLCSINLLPVTHSAKLWSPVQLDTLITASFFASYVCCHVECMWSPLHVWSYA